MSCTRHFTRNETLSAVENILLTESDKFHCPITYGFYGDMCDGKMSYDNVNPVGSRFYRGMHVRIGTKTMDEKFLKNILSSSMALFVSVTIMFMAV